MTRFLHTEPGTARGTLARHGHFFAQSSETLVSARVGEHPALVIPHGGRLYGRETLSSDIRDVRSSDRGAQLIGPLKTH